MKLSRAMSSSVSMPISYDGGLRRAHNGGVHRAAAEILGISKTIVAAAPVQRESGPDYYV
jgi:hypothetical protein